MKDTNGNVLPSLAADAIHIAAFFGDVTGDHVYNGTDASVEAKLAVHLITGFSNTYPLVDPVVIGDVTGDGKIQGVDASGIAKVAAHIPYANVASLPSGVTFPGTGGPDPTIYVPNNLVAQPGQTITVPIYMNVTESTGITLESTDVTLDYDPTVLTPLEDTGSQLGTLLPSRQI